MYRLARCRPWVAVGEEEAGEEEEPQLGSGLVLALVPVPQGRVRWRLAPMPDLAPVRLRA
jgi:hypothetical protein